MKQKLKNFFDRHSVLVFLLPYIILFSLFIIIPSVASVVLSFTDFNTIEFPHFVGIKNYIPAYKRYGVYKKCSAQYAQIRAVCGCGRVCFVIFYGLVAFAAYKNSPHDTYGNYVFAFNDGRRAAFYRMGRYV